MLDLYNLRKRSHGVFATVLIWFIGNFRSGFWFTVIGLVSHSHNFGSMSSRGTSFGVSTLLAVTVCGRDRKGHPVGKISRPRNPRRLSSEEVWEYLA